VAHLQRIRARFTKEGDAALISHLDTMRLFERALRRARQPVALSRGFNPRLKISLASALPVGTTSEAEYIDVELQERVEVGPFVDRLNEELPDMVRVLHAREVPRGAKSPAALINVAEYRVRVPLAGGADLEGGAVAVELSKFMERDEVIIDRERRGERRRVDLRPLIDSIELLSACDRSILLSLRLRTGSRGNARPDEVLDAISRYTSLEFDVPAASVHRTALYWEQGGRMRTPWDIT